MTKLDELKDYLGQVKSACQSGRTNPHMGVKWQDMEVLIQIAEAAFEMSEPMDRILGVCLFCESDQSGIFTPPIPHKPDCLYQRIQNGKKDLESGD